MKKKRFLLILSIFVVLGLTACRSALQIEIPGLEELQTETEPRDANGDPTDDLPAPPPQAEPLNLNNLQNLQDAYIDIYEKVIPSVVSISAIQNVRVDNFGDIPDLPFDFDIPDGEPFEYPSAASGSGFIWDKEGHIVTNNHVVEDRDLIRVNFSDGRSMVADLVGADADSDLAVLKVDLPADELVPISMTDSTQVKVGQIVVAIGNPFNLESSMTTGIVSGIGRSLPITSASDGYYSIPDIIQTDTAINPGNSGGVLVDINGGLIGVTTAIQSPVRANSGVGYVIPSVIAKKVVPLLIRDGQYLQPWIGVTIRPLTPEYAALMDLESDQKGALVAEVLPNSPAEQAGLVGSDKEGQIDGYDVIFGGDVIIAADGIQIDDEEDLIAFLARYTIVGQTITLTAIRDGEQIDLDLTLQTRPGSQPENDVLEPEEVSDGAWLGISGTSIVEDIAEEMDLPTDTTGVLIQTISAESPADEAGLRGSFKPIEINGQEVMVGGDIITNVDSDAVDSIEELSDRISKKEPGDEVVLSIIRDGETLQLEVILGEYPE